MWSLEDSPFSYTDVMAEFFALHMAGTNIALWTAFEADQGGMH